MENNNRKDLQRRSESAALAVSRARKGRGCAPVRCNGDSSNALALALAVFRVKDNCFLTVRGRCPKTEWNRGSYRLCTQRVQRCFLFCEVCYGL